MSTTLPLVREGMCVRVITDLEQVPVVGSRLHSRCPKLGAGAILLRVVFDSVGLLTNIKKHAGVVFVVIATDSHWLGSILFISQANYSRLADIQVFVEPVN